jgi:hypothetical protein
MADYCFIFTKIRSEYLKKRCEEIYRIVRPAILDENLNSVVKFPEATTPLYLAAFAVYFSINEQAASNLPIEEFCDVLSVKTNFSQRILRDLSRSVNKCINKRIIQIP